MARTLYQFFARTRIWFWWVCLFPALQIVNSGSGPPPGCSQQGGWFFVNSCGLSYLGEANSKVELWPSKRISRSWRHHLPTSLQSSRHGKRYIGDGNQSMCFFQASSKDVPRGRATLLDIQRYRQLPPRNHVNEHRCGGQLVRGHWPFILCSARDGRVTTGDKISLLEEKYWRALERSFLSSSYFCSCFLFFFVPFREAMSISAVPGQQKSLVGVVVVHDESSAHPEVCEIVRWHENMGSCLGVLGPWRNLEAKVGSPFAFSGVRPLKVERLESAVEVLFATVSNCSRWEWWLQDVWGGLLCCCGCSLDEKTRSGCILREETSNSLPFWQGSLTNWKRTWSQHAPMTSVRQGRGRWWSAFCGFSLMEPDTPQLSFMMKRQAWPCQTEGRCRTLRNKG